MNTLPIGLVCHAGLVKSRKLSVPGVNPVPRFDARVFLESAGGPKAVVKFGRNETVFRQGDTGRDVFYIQSGGVKLSVLSRTGKEAVVAMLGPGDFFGEGCMAGQPLRMGSATAITPSVIMLVSKKRMAVLLHEQPTMADRFIAHMLARYGKEDIPVRAVPKVSQETLAEMIGTTRSRVNFFMNKFKELGFIEYDEKRPLKINSSLLSVVLHD